MCGLFKNVTLWIISIIFQVSKNKNNTTFRFSQNIFDSRIASFRYICKVKNVTISYFRKGITFLSKHKSKKQKSSSTGGAGGLRSCDFVNIVLQSFFAIGIDGSVLPITPKYKISEQYTVGNVTKIVLSCIITLFDAYFAIQMSPITQDRLTLIKFKLNKMSKHFILMYQLNLKFCDQKHIDLPHSRKLHAAVCNIIPFLSHFGSVRKADTSSYESVHRVMTVGAWIKTSKRYESMNEEMAKQSLAQNYYYTNELLAAISNNNIVEYIQKFGPYIPPTVVIIKKVHIYQSFSLQIDINNNLFCDEENIDDVLLGSSVDINKLVRYTKRVLDTENWNRVKNYDNCVLNIVQSISIEGNKESQAGKIILYATNKFKNKRPRYSFVSVNICEGTQPAQILCFLEYIDYLNETQKYYAIIRYMMPVKENTKKNDNFIESIDSPFKLYEWEWNHLIRNRQRVRGNIITAIVEADTIVDTAFIIPVYTKNTTVPDCGNPEYNDRFWYGDKQFFDRSGWDDILLQDEIENDNENNDEIPGIYIVRDDNNDNIVTNIDSNSDDNDSDDYNNDGIYCD
jgi:hypothetical protein